MAQPGRSCLFRDRFCFLSESFLVMGPFSTTRNGPWSKNAESCLKITNNNSFFIGSCSLHVDYILLTTPNPFKENNYSVRELREGFKMEFPWMWVGPISILWDLNFVKMYIYSLAPKSLLKTDRLKLKLSLLSVKAKANFPGGCHDTH